MKTLKEIVLVILMLVPLAELVFLPWYLAHKTSVDLNSFTGSDVEPPIEPTAL